MGFLGGVAWAMLVARVCQLYPNACAGTLVAKFFLIMHQWEWPQPILLKPMEEGPLNVRIWNPKLYASDKLHRMPIITPAYPSMCATHNVTASTHTIMVDQFREATHVVNTIMLHHAPWDELFVPYDYFGRYRHYLQIIAASRRKEAHVRWSGLVESRLRQLVMKLEVIEGIALTHPYFKGIERHFHHVCDDSYVALSHGLWSATVHAGSNHIYTTSFYIGLKLKPPSRNGLLPSRRQLDISWPSTEFMDLVTSWEQFDGHSMSIAVQNLKR
ncbi:polynucleotide adenylyltransferase [Coelomomyces lativittatus]|nr:polynucleotide adenylyltransferase [Coelomomyces lativittatus]KAJ1514177.1 polynucleotide adenylyltransferase [Coelomomyces lativittatus]